MTQNCLFTLHISWLALAATSLSAQTPDLRGIWMATPPATLASLVFSSGLGLIVDPTDGEIPYRPEALAQLGRNFAEKGKNDPSRKCYQPGLPRAVYDGGRFQIFQNSRAVYIVYEETHAYRILYLDGSKHNEGLGYAMGDSRAHWEGETLVVDVTSFSDQTWFDTAGKFHSDALHIVERYTRTGPSALRYEATIEDPKVFTRPWTIRVPLTLQPNAELQEDECIEDGKGGRHHVSPSKGRN